MTSTVVLTGTLLRRTAVRSLRTLTGLRRTVTASPLTDPDAVRFDTDPDAVRSTALLGHAPKERLVEYGTGPTAIRAGTVAAHRAELRRIERDLYDATRARLVSLSLRIRLAQRAYDRDPQVARQLLADAQAQAQEALAELRHVVRGIHPPILTDRGLVGAVRALAAHSGLDVTTRVDGLGERPDAGPRVPAAVEAAAYFVVAEALANAARHGGPQRVSVQLQRTGARLRIVVRDEGRRGADEADGTGLLGIRRRVAALAGTVTVTAPVEGPTVIEVELPCVG